MATISNNTKWVVHAPSKAIKLERKQFYGNPSKLVHSKSKFTVRRNTETKAIIEPSISESASTPIFNYIQFLELASTYSQKLKSINPPKPMGNDYFKH